MALFSTKKDSQNLQLREQSGSPYILLRRMAILILGKLKSCASRFSGNLALATGIIINNGNAIGLQSVRSNK